MYVHVCLEIFQRKQIKENSRRGTIGRSYDLLLVSRRTSASGKIYFRRCSNKRGKSLPIRLTILFSWNRRRFQLLWTESVKSFANSFVAKKVEERHNECCAIAILVFRTYNFVHNIYIEHIDMYICNQSKSNLHLERRIDKKSLRK